MTGTDEVEGVIVLTSVVEQEDNQFVSFCVELGTASCGDTVQEAYENLQEAIWVHLNELEETGERDRVFRERNIDVLPSSKVEATLVGTSARVVKTTHKIPALA